MRGKDCLRDLLSFDNSEADALHANNELFRVLCDPVPLNAVPSYDRHKDVAAFSFNNTNRVARSILHKDAGQSLKLLKTFRSIGSLVGSVST